MGFAGLGGVNNPQSAIAFRYMSRPTSGASASIFRRSSSLASESRNRGGAARARVGARASLRQENTSAS